MSFPVFIALFDHGDQDHKDQRSNGSKRRHWTLYEQLDDSHNQEVKVGHPSELFIKVSGKKRNPSSFFYLQTQKK